MRVIETVQEMQDEARENLRRDATVGFVPTMGALHEGHLSLIERARSENDTVVISIFVNPIQFDEATDFDAYPRTLETDLAAAEEAGADLAFLPAAEEMYGANRDTIVMVDRLTRPLCGMSRGRGHFIGVCTVVAKLFNIVRPTVAYFGQKDAQQALVIQRMVRDLNFPLRVEVCPIIREEDGLAMSSRNVRIPPALRENALGLRRALVEGRRRIQEGERDARALAMAMTEMILQDPQVELDYLEIVSPETLDEVGQIDDIVLMAGAIRVGGVRLIDNVLVGPEGPWSD